MGRSRDRRRNKNEARSWLRNFVRYQGEEEREGGLSECLFVVCVRSRGGEVDGCARGCYCFFRSWHQQRPCLMWVIILVLSFYLSSHPHYYCCALMSLLLLLLPSSCAIVSVFVLLPWHLSS